MRNWYYALLVLLGGCCYGGLSTAVKLAYSKEFTFHEVAGAQYIFGALLGWVFYAFSWNKSRLSKKQVGKLMAMGVPFALTGILYYLSLNTLNASLAIVFLFQSVWIGVLIDWVVNKNRPTLRKILSVLALLFGSLLATGLLSGQEIRFDLRGAGWGMLAALAFASFIYISSAVETRLPALQRSTFLCTGSSLLVCVLLQPVTLLDISILLPLAPYGLFLGFLGVVLPPLLFSIGMPHVGPGLGTMLASSELPVAVILSAAILSENVDALQWIGVIIILSGIAVANLTPQRKNRQPEPQAHLE